MLPQMEDGSLPSKKFTDRFIKTAAAPREGRTEYFDTVQHGLRLRVTSNGVKSFSVVWRQGRRQRRYTLGKFDVISLAEARDMARDALREIARGNDPDLKRRRNAELASERSIATVTEEFMERHAMAKNRNWMESRRIFDRDILPYWRNRAVHEISRADVTSAWTGLPTGVLPSRRTGPIRRSTSSLPGVSRATTCR